MMISSTNRADFFAKCFAVALLASTYGLTLKAAPAVEQQAKDPDAVETTMLSRLDAPLLFVKRHSYQGIHIYDTFYKWPPGGGGIYVLENPSAPRDEWKIRAVIDAATPETLGSGVYTHPEISWDAKKLLFCYKAEPEGCTRIYEIGIDGTGLRKVSDPSDLVSCNKGNTKGMHDLSPSYLPDGRIIFLSTRPAGLVPCNNTGVSILHVMNADGTDIHPISVNSENEFDPAVLPDGRVAFGRWEYVDKNALTMQVALVDLSGRNRGDRDLRQQHGLAGSNARCSPCAGLRFAGRHSGQAQRAAAGFDRLYRSEQRQERHGWSVQLRTPRPT